MIGVGFGFGIRGENCRDWIELRYQLFFCMFSLLGSIRVGVGLTASFLYGYYCYCWVYYNWLHIHILNYGYRHINSYFDLDFGFNLICYWWDLDDLQFKYIPDILIKACLGWIFNFKYTWILSISMIISIFSSFFRLIDQYLLSIPCMIYYLYFLIFFSPALLLFYPSYSIFTHIPIPQSSLPINYQ